MPRRLLLVLCVGFSAACSQPEYTAQGLVKELHREERQVVIRHGVIPDLMPAMEMSFYVPDESVFERLEPGAVIEFTLSRAGNSLELTGFSNLDGGGAGRSGSVSPPQPSIASERSFAPDFDLTDQNGHSVRFADMRGDVVVLDFIFTNCSGPCPILTSSHVTLQRSIPAELRDRVRFVSITLDPRRDTPEAMLAYATARGADLSDWSFLTGPVDRIDHVVRSYGVGKAVGEDGEIQHTVASFLIDPEGRIAERYLGTDHDPAIMLSDLRSLL
jgi:protein SCO1/2